MHMDLAKIRYVISTSASATTDILSAATSAGVKIETIGVVTGDTLDVENTFTISVDELLDAHSAWMPNYMSNEA